MGFGMFGSFAGGMVQGAGLGLKIADAWDQAQERDAEKQYAKDSTESFKKIGKPDEQGFIADGGQIKVGNQQFDDAATANKFAGDKDLASFVTDGASDLANAAPTLLATGSATAVFPEADGSGRQLSQAAPAQQGAGMSEAEANKPIGMPVDPASITQTRLATPLPVQTLDRAGNDAPMKSYGMQDHLNFRATRAGELGMGKQADAAMAQALSQRFSSAALKAYEAGDYTEVYRLHNVLPDGYTVQREAIPANPDGTGGGVKLTMVNDKTGKVYGRPMTFGSDREAAGAFVAAAQQKLPEWLIAQGSQDHAMLKTMYAQQMSSARIQQQQDAAADKRDNTLLGLLMRGVGGMGGGGSANSGTGGGKGAGKGGDSLEYTKYAEWVAGKDPGSGGVAPWATTGYRAYQQMLDNDPKLAQSQGGKAMALEMSRNVALAGSGADVPVQGKANYRPLPMLKQDGTWAAGVTDENGRPYYLETNINPASLIRMDKDGKTPIGGIDEKFIRNSESTFMQGAAKSDPALFSTLAQNADNPEALKQMQALAQSGDPLAVRNLQVMQMVKKYGAEPAEPFTQKPSPAAGYTKPQFTRAELDAAKKFGVHEAGQPMWPAIKESVSNAADSTLKAVGGLIDSTRDRNFAQQLERFRSGQSPQSAGDLARLARINPAYAAKLTPDERRAIEVATGRRI